MTRQFLFARQFFFSLQCLVTCIVFVIAGCATSPNVAPSNPASEPATSTTASTQNEESIRVEYYQGDRRSLWSGDEELGRGAMLCMRTYNSSANTIVTEVIDVDPRPNVPTLVFVSTARVTGNKMTISEASGAFTGSGELDGPNWNWTGSTVNYQTPDGARIVAEEEVTDNGLYVVNKVFDPDGTLRVTFEETFLPITQDQYNDRKASALEKNEAIEPEDGEGEGWDE